MKAEIFFNLDPDIKQKAESNWLICNEDNHISKAFESMGFHPEDLSISHMVNFVIPGNVNDKPIVFENTLNNHKVWIKNSELNALKHHLKPSDEIISYEYVAGLIEPWGPSKELKASIDGYEVRIKYNRVEDDI